MNILASEAVRYVLESACHNIALSVVVIEALGDQADADELSEIGARLGQFRARLGEIRPCAPEPEPEGDLGHGG